MSEGGAAVLAAQWARLRAEGRTAVIPYVTAGYPSRHDTVSALQMLVEEGADIVEVGIPFSDPLADGPTIQHASFEALRGGMTVGGVLELVRDAAVPVPVILFSYLNPILQYGIERFLSDARAIGASGVLVTDLPAGSDPGVEQALAVSGLSRIPLVALTTARTRLAPAVEAGDGFVYLISRLGVTGARTTVSDRLGAMVRQLRSVTNLPIAVGFGIASGREASAVSRIADGVVVGSALVECLGRDVAAARTLMAELRQAVDAAPVAS